MSDSLQQVTDSIWFFPPDSDPNKVQPSVGVTCTEAQTILVDAGNGPLHADHIMTALQQIDAPPVSHIIYTHSHWDHIWGACVWNAPVIAHDSCAALVREMAAIDWGIDYLEQIKVENPARTISAKAMSAAVSDWESFKIVVPQVVFSEKILTLVLDELSISLEWVGGNHSADSIVVRVPERGVIFLGDCFYSPPIHPRTPESDMDWAMLRDLVDEDIEYYIDGHNGLNTRATVEAILDSM